MSPLVTSSTRRVPISTGDEKKNGLAQDWLNWAVEGHVDELLLECDWTAPENEESFALAAGLVGGRDLNARSLGSLETQRSRRGPQRGTERDRENAGERNRERN